MRDTLARVPLWILIGLGAASLACGSGEKTAPDPGADPSGFRDPFRYCQAVGNVDQPDSRWAGPKVPAVIVAGMQRENLLGDVPQQQIERGLFWRCMGGAVEVCFVGANIPCDQRADTSRTPSVPMVDFCKSNPNSSYLPASVTGRITIYEWRCAGGEPQITKTVDEPDARGFPSAYWNSLRPMAKP